jgi:DNA helicase-2/ATP-dependent DNA helicase PcrA
MKLLKKLILILTLCWSSTALADSPLTSTYFADVYMSETVVWQAKQAQGQITYEIMDYAKRISNHPHLEMVERHGVAVQTAGCKDEIEEMDFIANQIEQFKNSGNASLGIVTKTNADAKKLFDKISQKYNVTLLTNESTQFVNGISITSIQMAKGLEFDEVIVHDVSNVQYAEEYDRNLLFIACTRAMHKLTISYIGIPSRFLPV